MKLLNLIKNKYLISSLVLISWLLFFDKYDLVSQLEQRKKLNQLLEDKRYYTEEIAKNNNDLRELQTNPKTLEKYAREKYLMKKDDEDIFVIIDKTNESKKEQ